MSITAVLPELNPASLARYLDLDQVRELHRLRLVFLGTPAPGARQWMLSVIQAAESDPEGWAERRARAVMMSMELPGENVAPVPAEPVDRVTGQYREALAGESRP